MPVKAKRVRPYMKCWHH